MARNFVKAIFLYLFPLIIVTGFLIWPRATLAEINVEEALNNPDKIELKEKEAKKIWLSLIQKIVDEKINIITSPTASLEKEAILTILKLGIQRDIGNYLLIGIPKENIKTIGKYILKAAQLILTEDVSGIIGEFEKITVEEAKKYITKWLLQKEIKTVAANLEISFKDYENKGQNYVFPYIIVYKPLDTQSGEVGIGVYSSKEIKTPNPLSGLQWEGGIEELPPFIFKIDGTVMEQDDGSYIWIKGPRMEAVFDEPVPEFHFEKPGFLEKFRNSLNEKILALGNAGDFIWDFGNGVGGDIKDISISIFNKIKSTIYNFNLFGAQISAPDFLSFDSGLDLSNINIENLSNGQIPEIIEEIGQQQEKINEATQQLNTSEKPKMTLEEIQEALDDIAEKVDILSQEVAALTGSSQLAQNQPSGQEQNDGQQDDNSNEGDEQSQPEIITATSGSGGAIVYNYCQKTVGVSPERNKVILNEIAWMGTAISPTDEWIELKNITNDPIDVSRWQVLDKDAQIKAVLGEGSVIPANGFYLLERTDDNSVPGVRANLIYKGALGDSGESLYLFDNNCQLQDEVLADPDWPAGNKTEKRSMERENDFIWHTYSGTGTNIIMGTPKAENSQLSLSPNPPPTSGEDTTPPQILFSLNPSQDSLNFDIPFEIIDTVTPGLTEAATPGIDGFIFRWKEEGDWQEDSYQKVAGAPESYSGKRNFSGQNGKTYYFQISADDVTGNESGWMPEPPISAKITVLQPILINEIQIDGQQGKGGTDDDWVELYNPNDVDVSLNGWSIQKHSADLIRESCSINKSFYEKHFPEDAIIPAKGFFLVVDTKANDSIKSIADMTIGWSLSENNTIYLVRNQEKIDSGDDLDIIDKVGFGLACYPETSPALNPPEEESIARKDGVDTNNNSQDFSISENPSPTNSKKETTILADPLWPSFRHDAQRTAGVSFSGPALSQNPQAEIFIKKGAGDYFSPAVVDGNDNFYLPASIGGNQGIYCFSSAGSQKWYYPASSSITGLFLDKDRVVYFSTGKSITALNKLGALKWEKVFDNISVVSRSIIGEAGKIYFLASDSQGYKLIALDSSGGSEIWGYNIEDSLDGQEKILTIGNNNDIYFTDKNNLYAISQSGSLKWKKTFASSCSFYQCSPGASVPAIGPDGTIYLIISQEIDWRAMTDEGMAACLHAVDPENPDQEKWDKKCDQGFRSGFIAVSNSGNIYFSGGCAPAGYWIPIIYGFDSDGNNLPDWPFVVRSTNNFAGSPVVDGDGNVYANLGNHFKAFAPGSEKWSIDLEGVYEDEIIFNSQGFLFTFGRQINVVKP